MTEQNALRQRIARAIHRYDNQHALCGNDIASTHHLGEADFVLAELRTELTALAEYENTINWHTTCTSCARILDSAHRDTERAEKAEAALARVQDAAALHRKQLLSTAELYAVITALHPPAPAHDAGPTIAEATAADRNWDVERAGER